MYGAMTPVASAAAGATLNRAVTWPQAGTPSDPLAEPIAASTAGQAAVGVWLGDAAELQPAIATARVMIAVVRRHGTRKPLPACADALPIGEVSFVVVIP